MNRAVEQAVRALESRPDVAANPRARDMLEIIRNGDAERGETVANNLLGNYGMTKEQGIEAARRFFGL